MKKGFLTLVLTVISVMAFAQLQPAPEWTSILSNKPETFQKQLVSSTENSIKVNVQVPGFYTTEVRTPKGTAKVITMPKALSTALAGEPDVPMTGIPVMIGDKARMNVRIVDAQYMDFENIEVAPSKGDFPRTIDPETVPYTYGECYNKNAFFPAQNLEIHDPYIIRDFRGQNMAVYPFAYNPVTKTLRVYYNMTVEMYKLDDRGENVIEARRSNEVKMDPDFKSLYQRHFINFEEGMAKYTPLDEAGDLLIICYDNFISNMTDFVNWKKTRGINTTIVGTSTISSSLTYSNLKTYIQNQYNANNNITHVLLVGDVAQIPGYSYSGGGSSYSGLGDNAYGQVAGSDIYNDVIIGRFSASTAARVTTQCQRAITYERDLTTSDSWLSVGQGISKKEGGSGHNSEDDYQHMDNIRTDLLNYGYSPVYQRYENLSGYTATASQISTDINNGVGIINYCNHGAETMWGVASYSVSHVNALTNENKLPFVFSVACLVGKYDHSSDCFAEAWMNATNNNNPTGAISGMFSYISQPWIPPMWAQDEFIDILVESYSNNKKQTFAGAAINGLFGIFDHYSTSEAQAVGTYQAWVVYGDPTLMMRTKTPQAMTVTHAGSLPLGNSSYNLTVSNGNGAVATITDASHNILGKATVSNGSATISISNSSSLTANQELTLCVFGYNKVTYLGTITVVGGNQYNIGVSANPTAGGTVSGAGQYYENSQCTLTATANAHYEFTKWTKNGTQVSTANPYTFTVTGAADYVAQFTALNPHSVTCSTVQNGTISASPTTAYKGETVALSATPASGYFFESWTVKDANNNTITVNNNTFTMPDSNVTVSATFVPGYNVTLASVEHGTISATPTGGPAGTEVTLTATAATGYAFESWLVYQTGNTSNLVTVSNNKFNMPSFDVTVSATFVEKLEPETLTINGTSTTTNGYIPIYGLYADYGTISQFIIPASDIQNITAGSTISKITFYSNQASKSYFGSKAEVKIGEVSYTSFSSTTIVTSGLTTVTSSSTTTLSTNSSSELEITFETPYTYQGGNLLISVGGYGSSYTSTSWTGVSKSGNVAIYKNNSSNSGTIPSGSGTAVSFAPKTTITYTPSTTPSLALTPSSATILTGFTQTLTANTHNVSGTPAITYTSSNTNVATVNGNGNTATVTAVAPGTATITASMTYNGTAYTATCAVTVQDPSLCEPSFSNPSDDYISQFVTTGGTTNINNTSTYESSGYSDFYSTQSASIPVGETLSCTVTPSSTSWKYGHAIWVDWNKDYEFSSDERVAYTSSAASGNWTGSVTVPANTNGGDYRMRVIHYYNQASPSDPCVSAQYGEAEDYKLTVIANGTKYTITATANPTAGGTVTGAGQYYENTQCTLNATPNANYAFANWTKNGAVVSTNASYSFTVTENASYVANFNYINTVKIMPNDPEYGSVAFGGNRGTLTYDFEDGWQGWTTFQGSTTSPDSWMHSTEYVGYTSQGYIDLSTAGNSSSTGFMLSESYISATSSGGTAYGAVTPDNYLVSPQFRLGGSFKFYAAARMSNYPAEKFSVLVSTAGNTSASDFTGTLLTVTLTSSTYSWNEYTVDLSNYSGMGYVAIRHYDCNDQHLLYVDDVTIVEGEVSDGSLTATYVNGTSCTVVAIPNEGYRLANWTENGSVVSTSASYTFTVNANRDLVANFEAGSSTTVTQTVQMSSGTNWLTTYVGFTLEQLEAALGDNGLMISAQDGSSVTYDETFGWGGDLTAIEVGKMYIVQTKNNCTFEIEGTPIDPNDYTITLTHGNNWIGFNGNQATEINVALANLTATDNDVITAQDGLSASYDATFGWGGDLTTLQPGQAYIYTSNAAGTVTFKFASSKGGDTEIKEQDFHWSGFDYHAFMYHMDIRGKAYFDGVLQDDRPNIEIAAFVNGELRGTKYLVEAYPGPLPGVYFIWNACYYDNLGETFTFKAYDHDNNIEYDLCDVELIGTSTAQGTPSNPIAFHFTKTPSFGPDYPWTPSTAYSGNGMLVCAQVKIDGELVTRDTYEVGAFCGDECRANSNGGSGSNLDDWTDVNLGYFAWLTIMGNDGDVINFYLYDKASNSVVRAECPTTIELVNDGELGLDPENGDLFVLNFITTPYFTKDIVAYTPNTIDHYYLIASPIGTVAPTAVENMITSSSDYDLYYFDQTGDAEGKEWINYKSSSNGNFNLEPGKGYLYANENNVQLVFAGNPCEDDQVTLEYDGNADLKGWNLVGNPFGVEAYINRSFYRMNSDGTEVEAASGAIGVMEGIFVNTETEASETLTFSTQAPTKANEQLVLSLSSNRGRSIDRAIVSFDENSVLPKFQLFEGNSKLYIQQNGKDYAVVNSSNQGEVPVCFKAGENGTYTLSFNTEGVTMGYLHLIDNMTGDDVDLLATPSYSFNAKTSDYASRFKLVFVTGNSEDGNFAFFSNGSLVINNEGAATLQVIDVTGRIISTQSINGCCNTSVDAAAGVYTIRLINGSDMKTQKIILN